MRYLNRIGGAAILALLTACVTINVYFPAAAAQKAADRIINEVWGHQQDKSGTAPATPKAPAQPQSSLAPGAPATRLALEVFAGALEWLVPSAHAQANFDVSTPAIQRLTASMTHRHRQLLPYYRSGAVGQTRDGLVAVRDPKAVPLRDRNTVNQLVAAENRDRNALYADIARANGHPEWESQIRATFAQRWAQRAARAGWWYQNSGGAWQHG